MLPWLQERLRNDRDNVEALLDCDRCRGLREINEQDKVSALSKYERQSWGCPYEPRIERPSHVWTHRGYTDESPTTCAGYTTKLPEVIEINRARLHWKQGELREFCGDEPTENIHRGIEILEGAANEANCWREDDGK